MSRFALVSLSILLLCAVGILLSLNGCGGGGDTVTTKKLPPPNYNLPHVVIIFQENRPPDNLFQGLCSANGGVPGCGTNPGQYDIASSGVNSQQQSIPLTPIDLGTVGSLPQNYDTRHSHSDFVKMCDLNRSTGVCNMDGADQIPCDLPTTTCPASAYPNPQFKYVEPADVQPYLQMAEQYTFANRMFQTNQGPSFPAHQFILGGTSAPTATSNLFAAENGSTNAGCFSPPATTVGLIDPAGSETSNPPIYPCFEHATLTDLLDAANISWRYYTPSPGSIWTAPDAIQHMCGPNSPPPNATACVGPDWTGTAAKIVVGQTQSNPQVLADITTGQLPQVTWVIPDGQDSDHAWLNDGCGPSWVSSIVNAIGNSPYWPNTTIIIAWDDWGGWYDHVPPPQVLAGADCTQWGCGYVYGFRVPLIVMSPYTKSSYVSQVNHDFGSILKFIETKFKLPSLGYADANALDDLSDFFNLNQSPTTFQPITPPPNDAACKADTSPPSDPDDD